jgi:P-type Ca2+ transporter type 2C
MHRMPRDPTVGIANRFAITQWVVYAFVLFVAAFLPLVAGPDEPSTDHASAAMTMTFVVLGLGTAFNAITNRRDPTSGLAPPIVKALGFGAITVALLYLGTELPHLQTALMTAALTGTQWLAAIGLALLLPIVIEGWKWIRRRRMPEAAPIDPRRVVDPARAVPATA